VAARRAASTIAGIVGARNYEGFPSGFEWLGTNDYGALLSVPAALAFPQRCGPESVWSRNRALVAEGAARVTSALGFELAHSSTSPMAIMIPPSGVATTYGNAVRRRDALSQQAVEVALTPGRGRGLLRLSAHPYNSPADFDRLAVVLQDLMTT
jgi:isopenicillin-N epimerase